MKAERLFGLSDEIDGIVLQWSSLTDEDRIDVEEAVALGRQLLELVFPVAIPTAPTMRYAHLAPEVVNETVRLLDGPSAEWVPDGLGGVWAEKSKIVSK